MYDFKDVNNASLTGKTQGDRFWPHYFFFFFFFLFSSCHAAGNTWQGGRQYPFILHSVDCCKHLPLWGCVGPTWWLLQWGWCRPCAASTCNGNLRLSSWYQGTSAGSSQHQMWVSTHGTQLVGLAVGDLHWARLSERSPRRNKPVASQSRLHSSMEIVSHLCWTLCGKFSHFYKGRWGTLKAWECLNLHGPSLCWVGSVYNHTAKSSAAPGIMDFSH